MITLCLIGLGFSVLVFLLALRGAVAGHEDDRGFQADPLDGTDQRQASGSRPANRPKVGRVPRASPWRRLPHHAQDEIDLLMAREVIRGKSHSPL